MIINIAGFMEHSLVNGPGRRAVLWVQGCPFRCDGCFNPEMQPFMEKEIYPVNEMAERILSIEGIEGVTFTGGEPFAQPSSLSCLGEILQDNNLNIVAFTGYTLEELREAGNPDWKHLLSVTDLLIDGPFIKKKYDKLPLRGSTNQRLMFLSDRFRNHIDLDGNLSHAMEFLIRTDGNISLSGFPEDNIRKFAV
jgi:anaerobic ribonucleoside-triphosphate reductase activating protein